MIKVVKYTNLKYNFLCFLEEWSLRSSNPATTSSDQARYQKGYVLMILLLENRLIKKK